MKGRRWIGRHFDELQDTLSASSSLKLYRLEPLTSRETTETGTKSTFRAEERAMRLGTRLRRLEQQVRAPGCPACRERRGQAVFIDVQRQPDGQMTSAAEWPRLCTDCGKLPELVIEIVHPDKGETAEALADST